VINDILQSSIATHFRHGGVVNNQIKKGLLPSLQVKILFFLISEYLAKLPARRRLSHALCAPGYHAVKSQTKCTTQSIFLSVTIWLLTIPPHLKYVTTVPCNLSLITALVCDCRSLSDISVSQGSAVTHMRCGGIFSKHFAANLLENRTVKTFENQL